MDAHFCAQTTNGYTAKAPLYSLLSAEANRLGADSCSTRAFAKSPLMWDKGSKRIINASGNADAPSKTDGPTERVFLWIRTKAAAGHRRIPAATALAPRPAITAAEWMAEII